jgi:hypothetical protein
MDAFDTSDGIVQERPKQTRSLSKIWGPLMNHKFQLTKLELSFKQIDAIFTSRFVKFLNDQHNLKVLNLQVPYELFHLMYEEDFEPRFNLEELSIICQSDFGDIFLFNAPFVITKFLKSQKDSLEILNT